jgi:16S rRNA (adenine1518-N6/adenine1519-N6)-dimethyltransferase
VSRPKRRRLGQNYLVDRSVARRIAELTDPNLPRVLEVGPGRGALTGYLMERHQRVVALELDESLIEPLRARFPGGSFEVRHADAVREDLGFLGAEAPWQVAANLPYSVGSAILRRLMERPDLFTRLVVMLQLEVVERLLATPASKGHGLMALERAARAEADLAFKVPPAAFRPRPKVMSAVVVLTPRQPTWPDDVIDGALAVASRALTRPRKTLANALKGVVPPEVLPSSGLDSSRRPGTLELDEWVALHQATLETARVPD